MKRVLRTNILMSNPKIVKSKSVVFSRSKTKINFDNVILILTCNIAIYRTSINARFVRNSTGIDRIRLKEEKSVVVV